MRDVDWLSVFKNNAQKVRVLLTCKDPSKVPSGILFEFHKNLFTLGFTVEKNSGDIDGNVDLLGEDSEDQDRRNEGDGANGQNRMDTDGSGGTLPKSNTQTNNGGAIHHSGPTRTRMAASHGENQVDEGVNTASVVFQLLVQRGLVDKDGCFVGDKSAVEEAVLDETERF
jgi:hypothetical protein